MQNKTSPEQTSKGFPFRARRALPAFTNQEFEDIQAAVLYMLVALKQANPRDAIRHDRFQALHEKLSDMEASR